MNDFIETLERMQQEQENAERKLFWKGHSVFQLPYKVIAYRGRAEALVLLYLYERASAEPFKCQTQVIIEIEVEEKTIASHTGLGRWAVSQAIRVLEAAGCIRVRRTRSKLTGRWRVSIYLLLHPQTAEPLTATPQQFGICHSNGFERPYLTVPKETREMLAQMRPAGRAVLLTALAVTSKHMMTVIGVTREHLQTESLLGRNAFNRGLLECKVKGLLAYKRGILTLHDFRTQAPSERWKYPRERIEHANPKWKFDLDSVTGAQWQPIIEGVFSRKFIVGSDGWTNTTGQHCPFCKMPRCFAVNFQRSQYICHEGCGKGRLGQLVCRALRVPMTEAKRHIQSAIQAQTPAAAA